ncbi:HIT family protein [Candidatus Woesearchaeota archaeon]|nr:HIT family protein [Candidatus Woesearchaeota archaeon]
MADCTICTAYQKKELAIVYEDATVMAFLSPAPASVGHLRVCTKSHVQKLRDVPDAIASYLFFTASFAAMTVFDQLGAHGTNIILNEGLDRYGPHASIDIIPRKADDGLSFQWEPKQLGESAMASVMERLKDKAFFIGKEKPAKQEPASVDKAPERMEKKQEEGVDYQIRHIMRIP